MWFNPIMREREIFNLDLGERERDFVCNSILFEYEKNFTLLRREVLLFFNQLFSNQQNKIKSLTNNDDDDDGERRRFCGNFFFALPCLAAAAMKDRARALVGNDSCRRFLLAGLTDDDDAARGDGNCHFLGLRFGPFRFASRDGAGRNVIGPHSLRFSAGDSSYTVLNSTIFATFALFIPMTSRFLCIAVQCLMF